MGIVVARTFIVTAAADAVLDYLKDFGNTGEWDARTLETTRTDPGPVVVGTRWHNRSKILGLTTELTYTLCAVESDELVFMGRNEGATSTDTITVRPVTGGSEVDVPRRTRDARPGQTGHPGDEDRPREARHRDGGPADRRAEPAVVGGVTPPAGGTEPDRRGPRPTVIDRRQNRRAGVRPPGRSPTTA